MTVYLIDPFLIDYSGHCFNYLEVVRQVLNEKNIESQIIGNEICISELSAAGVQGFFPKAALTPVKHKFHRSIISYIKSIAGFQNDSDVEQFKNDFGNLIEKIKPTCNDVIFINSLRPGQVLALARWLNEQNLSQCPRIILVLHFTSNLKSWAGLVFATQYRDAFKICKGAIRLGRFILFADTEELIAEYERLGALKIHLAPIPSNLSVSKNLTISLNQENENQSEITQKKPIIVSFVGQARRDKGFYSLLEIVKNFSDEIHKHKIKFIVQTGPIDQLKLADREYIEKLRNFDVEIVDKILDKNAYYQLIETADVILLPYIGYSYNSQSSGIFSEAISMGKIIVAPDQSWMGRQLIRLGLKNQNKSIKRNHLVKQIVEDIHESVNNYHQINQNYRNARVKWIKYNDISFIIRELEF